MESAPFCEHCNRSMGFVRKLALDAGRGSYNIYRCQICKGSQLVPMLFTTDQEKSEIARLSLDVMCILQSMSVEDIRQLVAEMEAKIRKMH